MSKDISVQNLKSSKENIKFTREQIGELIEKSIQLQKKGYLLTNADIINQFSGTRFDYFEVLEIFREIKQKLS